MKLSNISLKALSLSVAALALNAGAAHASTIGIFGGGSTLSFTLDDEVGQCVGLPNSSNDSDTKAAAALGDCSNNAAYEYLFNGPGSGVALQALTTNYSAAAAAANTAAFAGKYNYTDAANGFNESAGFPSWELSFSDAPLDTPDTITSLTNTKTFGAEYVAAIAGTTTSGTTVKNITLPDLRGALWQVPVTATPVTLPYNLPSAAFGTTFYGPATATETVSDVLGSYNKTGTVTALDLSTDMVCYIWTNETAKGVAVSGTRTWDNPIFTGTYTVKATNKTYTSFDSNLKASGVTGLAINPVVRSDASGTTYLFTLWLSNNCKGYTAAGWSTPAVLVAVPSFITLSGSGSGGMLTAVTTHSGAIGYITPDKVAPISGTVPAAFLQITKDVAAGSSMADFLYPTITNTELSETGVALPTVSTYTKWGTTLNKAFFTAASKSYGYPITGLTYVMGYSCYDNDSSNNELGGVANFLNFMGTADYQTLAASNGFAPLTAAQYQAIATLITTASTKTTVAGLTGVSATPVTTTTGTGTHTKTVTTYGPATCPDFSSPNFAQDYK